MASGLLSEPWRGRSVQRAAIVLLIVLLLHAFALLGARRELALSGPETMTQTTLSVALLRAPAPPPPAPVVRPAPPKAQSIRPAAPAPVPSPAEPVAPDPPVEPSPAPPPVVEPTPPTEPEPPPSMAANAQSLPTKGRIAYRTRYSRMRGIEALTYVDWSIDLEKSRYELWLRTVDPPGLLDLKSSGELRSFGIAPFKYIERIDIANRELSVDFDWEQYRVNFVGRNAGEPMPFVEGTQDPLSLQFHLPLLAQTYPWRFTPGSEVQFLVARRRVESYTFIVTGFESVRISGKDIQALKVERPRGPNANRSVELWMAPQFDWIPARLRFVDANDEVWDSELAHLPGVEPPPAEPIQMERVPP
jgi:hypothetical protein